MKEFIMIIIGWICWFCIIYPSIDNVATSNELIEKVEGHYTSESIISDKNMKRIYTVKNVDITFKDGVYSVKYDEYSKCENFYESTYTCADNNEKFIETVASKGKYTIENDKLILKIDGYTRECEINYTSIDCTESGGWLYSKK